MGGGNLVTAILAVVILIALGYLVKRIGLLSVEDRQVLNNIIIYLAMPCLVFRSVVQSKMDVSLLKIPALAIGVMIASIGVAYVAGRLLKLDSATFGALLLVSAVGNTGYLGYPLAINLFGQENLVRAVFFDIFGTVFFAFTVGIFIAHRYGNHEHKLNVVREFFSFPPFLGLAIAVVIRGVTLPVFMTKAVGFMADATIPLIMLSIGLSIELGNVLEHKKPLAVAAAIKLLIAPLIAFAVVKTLGFSQVDASISVLESSMPAMMISLVIGLKYGLDVEFMPAAIVGTTLISLATIPLWQSAVHLL